MRTSARQVQLAAAAVRNQFSASDSVPGCLAVSFLSPCQLTTFTNRCYQNDNTYASEKCLCPILGRCAARRAAWTRPPGERWGCGLESWRLAGWGLRGLPGAVGFTWR